MQARSSAHLRLCIFLISALVLSSFAAAPDARMPSWNDSVSRTAITEFVDGVTNRNSPDFVPVADRIAVFDNDGTLWSEQPMNIELAFAFDRLKLDPQA